MKSKKKILIIAKSFYPENTPRAFRATELVKEFRRMGHIVTIMTYVHEPEHSYFQNQWQVEFIDLGKRALPEIKYTSSIKLVALFYRLMRRFLLMLFEYPDIELLFKVKRALKNINSYNLMISVAVPHPIHWGVAWARAKNTPIAGLWVADCGDPYMGQENDTFKHPFYFMYFEKWFCRKADFITIPFKEAQNAYYSEFYDKIKVIPQGFKFEDRENIENIENGVKPTFIYAGNFIPGLRDPREFIDYIKKSPGNFVFKIYTRNQGFLSGYAKDQKDRIKVLPFISRAQLMSELNAADFVVNFENFGTTQMPSKLIDYAILDKPILSIKTGALDTKVVDQFLDGDFKNRYLVQNIDQYRIENVSTKFLGLLSSD